MDSNIEKTHKERWIIDTDPGCDDMMTLMYLFNRPDVEIEFITLSEGNCKMDDLIRNIKKTFKLYGKEYPVYCGSRNQFFPGHANAYDYHWEDGLGGIQEIMDMKVDDFKINTTQHSALEIVKAVNKEPGKINLLALAPLTNLALAAMIDPNIGTKFKNVVLMGGSYSFSGNVSSSAEFNFYHDFIAAHNFLKKFPNLLITAWEPTCNVFFNTSLLEEAKNISIKNYGGYNEKLYFFIEKIISKYTGKRIGVQICDFYAILVYFNFNAVEKYFLAQQDVVVDSDKMKGALFLKNKEEINIPFSEYMKEYYIQKREYKENYNIYISKLDIKEITKEFAYIIKPLE